MKHEWKKHEKDLYLPKEKPSLIDIPSFKFITIKGYGNPNGEDFAERVGVLYSLAYGIKMLPKKGIIPFEYFDYTVYPLEGLWDISDDAKVNNTFSKEELVYTIMIRQPDFVTEGLFESVLEMVKKKKPHPLLDDVNFELITDGLSVQMMHYGPYDDEPKSFDLMKAYIKDNNLEIKTLVHREIYISDARKTEPSKLKTVLRYTVK